MSESSSLQAANTVVTSDSFSVAAAIGARVSEGGVVLWLLGAFSLAVVAIVLVKAVQFGRLRIWSRAWLDQVWSEARAGAAGMDQTLQRVRAHPSPVARVVEAVLQGRLASLSQGERSRSELPEAELRDEVERVAHEQLGQLESGLRGLESIGTLAPLLGLLGTVLGMIRAFAQLESAGRAVDPSILSGGIWEALLTTAVGLAVAIPALAALAWLDGQVDGVRRRLGDAATRALAIAAWRSAAPQPAGASETDARVIAGAMPTDATRTDATPTDATPTQTGRASQRAL